jgi:O-antigen ligase
LIIGAIFRPEEGAFRLAFASLFLAVSYRSPRLGIFLLCLSCAWWEIPILHLGLPNQFLIESGIIGFVGGVALRRPNSWTPIRKLGYHPLSAILVFSIVAGLVSSPISWGYWSSEAPIRELARAFTYIVPRIFNWDSSDIFSHSWSIMLGFLIQLSLAAAILGIRERVELDGRSEPLELNTVLTAFVMGVFPVVGFALAQRLELSFAPVKFSPDFGGTFQNGNHLSFYAAFIFLFCIYLLAQRTFGRIWCRIAVFLAASASLVGIFLGRGRSTWIALVVLGVIGIGMGFLRSVRAKSSRESLIIFGAAIASVSSVVVGSIAYYRSVMTPEEQAIVGQVIILFSEGRWFELITVSGRELAYSIALVALKAKPLTGVGLGQFFSLSGLQIDLHNTYLNILVELGVLSFVPLMFGLYATLLLVRYAKNQPASRRILIVSIIVLCAVVGLGDVPFHYRSLLTMLTIFFASVMPMQSQVERPDFWWKPVIVAGLFAGGLALFMPQVRHLVSNPVSVNQLSWFKAEIKGIGHHCATLPRAPDHIAGSTVIGLKTDTLEVSQRWDIDLSEVRALPTLFDPYRAIKVPEGGPFEICVCLPGKEHLDGQLSLVVMSRRLFSEPIRGSKSHLHNRQPIDASFAACDDFLIPQNYSAKDAL